MKEILTADIIDSDQLNGLKKAELQKALELLSKQSKGVYDFFIRGDSFQILLENDGLKESLFIKSYLKYHLGIDVRIAIGIGTVQHIAHKLGNSDGQAFTLSGRALDLMKEQNKKISIKTANNDINEEWNVHTAVLDHLDSMQSPNQAEAIFWYIQGKTQSEIAGILGISQPSVNARLKSAGWYLTEKIMNRYQTIKSRL